MYDEKVIAFKKYCEDNVHSESKLTLELNKIKASYEAKICSLKADLLAKIEVYSMQCTEA